MVHCEIHYTGGLRNRASHGPSGVEIVTDAPVDNRGKGESFRRPTWWAWPSEPACSR
ncbi:MAG: hypothetical protein R3E96_08145 [Planctomycetota bacterium]